MDGTSLSGLSNHRAVDVLRATGSCVTLRLARYLRGPKYEQLQQAIANSEMRTTPGTPTAYHQVRVSCINLHGVCQTILDVDKIKTCRLKKVYSPELLGPENA